MGINSFPIWAILIVIVIEIIIVAISYNKNNFIFAIPLALVTTFYPFIFAKLGWTKLDYYDLRSLMESFTLGYFALRFVLQYVINFIGLKIADRFSSGSTTAGGYVFWFIISMNIINFIISFLLSFI